MALKSQGMLRIRYVPKTDNSLSGGDDNLLTIRRERDAFHRLAVPMILAFLCSILN
jgi:hypothetical protein